ncbi:MAG: PadR family transcriptional regulator [Acidobacteria bacterium]|nr:PadR family transcriptional regulator [Acidobacteriota bacterium]
MGKGDYLGEFELLVMATLVRLGEEAYGMRIRRDIEERTERTVSIGNVYAALRRLDAKGYIGARKGAPTSERGGRAKRFYYLEPEGAAALERSRNLFLTVLADLPETLV